MLKKNIEYMNPFTEQMVTEEHYFHLPKAELVRMEMEAHGQTYKATKGELAGQELSGAQAKLQRMVEAEDGKAVLTEFEDILRRSYGKKDGERFLRSPEIWEEFSSSEAYSEFVFSLFTKPDEMANFIKAVFPGNLDEIAAEVAARGEAEDAQLNGATPPPVVHASLQQRLSAATPENPVVLTQGDIREMGADNLQAGLADGRFKLA